MASGSSGRTGSGSGSGSKGFDFGSDDLLCSYDEFGNQETSNGNRTDPMIGNNSGNDFRESRKARSGLLHVYNQPDESPNLDLLSTVEKTMKKYADNLLRFLEGISARLSQLELYCYNLEKSVGEMRSDLLCEHKEADLKLKSLEKHLQELSNYSSFEGVLYCKPHFDQLFKMTGSLDKSFESAPKVVKVDRSVDQGHANNKVSSMFAGTQDKCVACKKTVYPIEKIAVDGTSYHRACFKCTHGGCVISPSNYVAHEHRLYCKHHHSQLFKEKGNFSQLDKHEHIQVVTENTAAAE